MTATTTAKKSDGTVELLFAHHLSKVRITIESWSNEYTEDKQVINSLELKSLSGGMSYDGVVAMGDMATKWVKSYASTSNTTYVAIVAPGMYEANEEIMKLYVNDSSLPLIVKTSKAVIIESSKAYNFKLAIGNDLATITSSVVISDWEDEVLDDQQANMTDSSEPEKIEYTLTQGYASEGTLNNNASHRVKTSFIYGNFSVRVNDGYGTVTELLNALSITKLIRKSPDDLSEAVKYYVDMLKNIHSVEVEDGLVPDMKETALDWANFVSAHIPEEQGKKLCDLINSVP
jgi:hypothetical protein